MKLDGAVAREARNEVRDVDVGRDCGCLMRDTDETERGQMEHERVGHASANDEHQTSRLLPDAFEVGDVAELSLTPENPIADEIGISALLHVTARSAGFRGGV